MITKSLDGHSKIMAMGMNKEDEPLGKCEHANQQTTQWMFRKAYEIGFTEFEIDKLRTIYDRTEPSFLKGMK